MPNTRIKPTGATVGMMRAASIIVALIGTGMIVAAVSNGLLEEGGTFVVIWIAACVGIIGFALFMAFNRKGIAEGVVSIEEEGESSSGTRGEPVEARLKTLDSLKRKGLISDEEYRKQREKIIQSV